MSASLIDRFKFAVNRRLLKLWNYLSDFRKTELINRLNKMKGVSIAGDFNFDEPYRIHVMPGVRAFDIDSGVVVRSFCNILVHPQATLIINKNVFLNNYCSINCLGTIEIGENTLFGEGVKIYDHNHKHGNQDGQLLIKRNEFKIGEVKIGNNCWIGSNVTILSNVTIGDNVIIGAGVLVHKSIPSNTIVKLKCDVMMENRNNHNG